MSAKELVDLALSETLFSDRRAGRTPHQTMKSKLSVEIRRHGARSRFVRTAPGRFYLRQLAYPTDIYHAPPLVRPHTSERVLVFPAKRLNALGRFQGITRDTDRVLGEILARGWTYKDRLDAEQDDDHKQVLTYIMVTRGSHMLCFERGTYNRVEDFLRGLACIGFGGHVTSDDHSLLSQRDAGIRGSAARELGEELDLPGSDRSRLEAGEGLNVVGLLNDDSSAVGRRHFAVVLQYEVGSDIGWNEPRRGEKSITRLRWMDPAQEDIQLVRFEYWSQLCLRTYFPRVVTGRASHSLRRRGPFRTPHLLCVIGQIGSGKTEVTSILKSDFGYAEINSGRLVAELIERSPITPQGEARRTSFQDAALAFIRSPSGPACLADAIWQRAQESGADRIVIDGIRQRFTLEALAQATQGSRVGSLYVQTPPDIAFSFYKSRRGPNTTMSDFTVVRDALVEEEVPDLISLADAVIYNWSGRTALRTTVRALMRESGVTRRG